MFTYIFTSINTVWISSCYGLFTLGLQRGSAHSIKSLHSLDRNFFFYFVNTLTSVFSPFSVSLHWNGYYTFGLIPPLSGLFKHAYHYAFSPISSDLREVFYPLISNSQLFW